MAEKKAPVQGAKPGTSKTAPSEVTVEYIKENDFAPLYVKKYAPRSVYKPPRKSTGKGYFSKTAGNMVKTIVHNTMGSQGARSRRSTRARQASSNISDLHDNPDERTKEKDDNPAEDVEEISEDASTEKELPQNIPASTDPAEPKESDPVSQRGDTPKQTCSVPPKTPASVPTSERSPPPLNTSLIVQDTISSLVNLFGERKRHQTPPIMRASTIPPRPSRGRQSSIVKADISETVLTSKSTVDPQIVSANNLKPQRTSGNTRSKVAKESILEQLTNEIFASLKERPGEKRPRPAAAAAAAEKAEETYQTLGETGLQSQKGEGFRQTGARKPREALKVFSLRSKGDVLQDDSNSPNSDQSQKKRKREDSPNESVRRGRGRPKKARLTETPNDIPEKDSTHNLSQSIDSADPLPSLSNKPLNEPVKRGRGRPKKTHVIETLTSAPEEESTSDLMHVDVDSTDHPHSVSDESLNKSVKKGRGRPKKSQLNETVNSTQEEESTINLTQEIIMNFDSADPLPSVSDESLNKPVKRGRGRPKKSRFGTPTHLVQALNVNVDSADSVSDISPKSTSDISLDNDPTKYRKSADQRVRSRSSTPVNIERPQEEPWSSRRSGRSRSSTPVSLDGLELGAPGRNTRSRSSTPVSVTSWRSISPAPAQQRGSHKRRGRPTKQSRRAEESLPEAEMGIAAFDAGMEEDPIRGEADDKERGGEDTIISGTQGTRKKRRGRPPQRYIHSGEANSKEDEKQPVEGHQDLEERAGEIVHPTAGENLFSGRKRKGKGPIRKNMDYEDVSGDDKSKDEVTTQFKMTSREHNNLLPASAFTSVDAGPSLLRGNVSSPVSVGLQIDKQNESRKQQASDKEDDSDLSSSMIEKSGVKAASAEERNALIRGSVGGVRQCTPHKDSQLASHGENQNQSVSDLGEAESFLDSEGNMLDISISFATSTPVITSRKRKLTDPITPSPAPGVKIENPDGEQTTPVAKIASTPKGYKPLPWSRSSTEIPSPRHEKCPRCLRVYTRKYLHVHATKCPGRDPAQPAQGAAGRSEENPLSDWSLLNSSVDVSGTTGAEVASTSGRTGRSAARKARTNIQSFIRDMGPDGSDGQQENKTKTGREVKYKLVKAKKKPVTKYFTFKWKKDIAENRPILCPYYHCQLKFDSYDEIVKHYTSCKHIPKREDFYECSRCRYRSKTEELAKDHAAKHNWEIDAMNEIGFDSDTDFVGQDGESDKETESDGGEEDEKRIKVSTAGKKRPAANSVKSSIPARRRAGTSRGLLAAPSQERLEMLHTLSWTLDWRAKHKQTDMSLFNRWRPRASQWKKLTPSEAETFLPQSQFSPWYRQEGKKNDEPDIKFLPRFQSSIEAPIVLNAGGPVWAMDWLPREDGVVSTQYLALYAHRYYDQNHTLMRGSSSNSAIQIWDCSTMMSGTIDQNPKLALVLAEPDGPIWDMKWCPRRSYKSEKSNSPDLLPLLGLLAVATCSGKIHIYSIPEPGRLPREEREEVPTYSTSPVFTLLPHTAGGEVPDHYNVCLCLDWQYLDGTTRLLAGYGDGMVSIFDIGTTSPLLQVMGLEKDGVFIHPLTTFAAHQGPVTSVALNQRRPQFFTSVSQDRSMKVWNMENLDSPVNAIPKSEFTAVAWPLHWPVTLCGADNCYSLEHNAVYLIDAGYFGLQNRPLTVHNACIMDLSFSDWLNSLVSVDSAGVVESIYLPFLLSVHKNHKAFSSRRMVLYSVDSEPLDPCICEVPTRDENNSQSSICTSCRLPLPSDSKTKEPVTPSKKVAGERTYSSSAFLTSVQRVMEKMDTPLPTDLQPRNIGEMKEGYTLVFKDGNMKTINTRKEVKISSAKELKQDVLCPLLASQNKIEWNPNLGSHLWQAVGGESGLVRLVHLPLFSNKQERDFVKNVFSQTQNGCDQEEKDDEKTTSDNPEEEGTSDCL